MSGVKIRSRLKLNNKGGKSMHFIWSLIVGGVIGLIAGAITSRGAKMGIISNILAGLIGSAIGEGLLGHWGPQLAGMAILPSIIGAVILVLVVSAIFGRAKN